MSAKPTRDCWNCGRRHQFHKGALCPVFGKICSKCNKPNHFPAKCRSSLQRNVQAVDEDNEVFPTEISAVGVDDSQLVTVQLESGNYLRFQVDTGAQCNVKLYQNAAKDKRLRNITPTKSSIAAYGGTTLSVMGTVALKVK